MDKKMSDFPQVSVLAVSDIIPVLSGGDNKSVTFGALVLNLPNIGNKGITKNAPKTASGVSIPLTGTLVTLPPIVQSYTLGNGSDGQELMLVSLGPNTVIPTSSSVTSVFMGNESTISLTFVAEIGKWVVKSFYGCTVNF